MAVIGQTGVAALHRKAPSRVPASSRRTGRISDDRPASSNPRWIRLWVTPDSIRARGQTIRSSSTVLPAPRCRRLQAADKGVELAGVLPEAPLPVVADRRAVKQIALNLMSNAVKFTPAGGSVTVTLEGLDDAVELSVADTGVGIAPEDLQRLGRPFEQAGGADQRAQGTGLGLSLVRSLTELHGGRTVIDSTLGEGTAISVRLPNARTD